MKNVIMYFFALPFFLLILGESLEAQDMLKAAKAAEVKALLKQCSRLTKLVETYVAESKALLEQCSRLTRPVETYMVGGSSEEQFLSFFTETRWVFYDLPNNEEEGLSKPSKEEIDN